MVLQGGRLAPAANSAIGGIRIVQRTICGRFLPVGKGIFRLRRKIPAGASHPPYGLNRRKGNRKRFPFVKLAAYSAEII